MNNLISIKYYKNIGYYIQLLLFILTAIPFVFLTYFVTVRGQFLAIPLMLLVVGYNIYLFIILRGFKEIKITKTGVIIHGKSYDPKFIEFKFHSIYTSTIRFCSIYYFGNRILTFIYSTILMGYATRTDPAKILDTLKKIKKGVEVNTPIDHETYIKESKSAGRLLLIILLIVSLPVLAVLLLSKIQT